MRGGKRANSGRKPKPKQDLRTLSCTCDAVVYDQVKLLAENKGQSISQWLADAAKRHAAMQVMGNL